MSETVEPLLVDLVEWIAKEDRLYPDVMEAWRTSCPRLPVWEEANARGLVTRARGIVRVTDEGLRFLKEQRV